MCYRSRDHRTHANNVAQPCVGMRNSEHHSRTQGEEYSEDVIDSGPHEVEHDGGKNSLGDTKKDKNTFEPS